MKKGQYWIYLVLGLLLVLTATQCGGPAQPTATKPPTVKKEEATTASEPTEPAKEAAPNIFIYGHGTTFPDIDPAISFSNDSAVVSNCYETLTFYNATRQ